MKEKERKGAFVVHAFVVQHLTCAATAPNCNKNQPQPQTDTASDLNTSGEDESDSDDGKTDQNDFSQMEYTVKSSSVVTVILIVPVGLSTRAFSIASHWKI